MVVLMLTIQSLGEMLRQVRKLSSLLLLTLRTYVLYPLLTVAMRILDVMLLTLLWMRNALAQSRMITTHPMFPLANFVTKVTAVLALLAMLQSFEERMEQLEKTNPHVLLMLKTHQLYSLPTSV